MKTLLKKMRASAYNKTHGVCIYSTLASLNANYGKDVIISSGTSVTEDVSIGDYSYVNSNSSVENCVIGKYCSISSGVYICPFEHDINMRTTHPVCRQGYPVTERKKVIIGNDVLISLNVVILEGVKVGNGAVIGAGAIVTKDVMPYEIVGGVPAKHIKFRFSENEVKQLEKLAWWDWNREKVLKNIKYLRRESEVISK